jgi:hypothetical protein
MTASQGEARVGDPFDGLPLLIPVPRAAKLLGISRAAAYRFASAGDLPTKRLGRRVGQATRVHRDGGRSRMKGRVYRRGKSWYFRFDIEPDPLTGKRRQVNGSGYKTEREAWKTCREAMADQDKGAWSARPAARSARPWTNG